MQQKKALLFVGIAFGILAGALAVMAPASAAPVPQAYDPGKVYDETFNNYTTALNVTANMTEAMEFNMDCGNNDVDVLYVWLAADQDLTWHVNVAGPNQTRFEAHIKNSEHFEMATTAIGIQFGNDFLL